MGRSFIALAVAVIAFATAAPVRSAGAGMHPGDVLVYDVALEFQNHVIPASNSSVKPISMDTTLRGTETIAARSVDADGAVHVTATVALQGSYAGLPQAVDRTIPLTVMPDGSIRADDPQDASTAQYFAYLSQASRGLAARPLHVGDSFVRDVPVPGGYVDRIRSVSKVVSESRYRGYPTFAIQSTGDADLNSQIAGARATGKVSVAGTTYYDQVDQLLVGAAVRSNVDADMTGSTTGHISAITTMNLLLASWTHKASASPSASPSPIPTAAPSPVPSPTPAPSPTSGYYTPIPPAPPAPTSVPPTTAP
jgi:hypothetical protein